MWRAFSGLPTGILAVLSEVYTCQRVQFAQEYNVLLHTINLHGFFFTSALKDGASQSGVADPHAVVFSASLLLYAPTTRVWVDNYTVYHVTHDT